MDTNRSFRLSGQVIIGVAAILFGILFLLDNLDVVDARIYIRYWPVFLILVGIVRLVQPKAAGGGRFFGAVIAVIGIVLLLRTLDISDIGLRELWPLILVLIGGSLVWGSTSRAKTLTGDGPAADSNSSVNGFAVLGGFARSNNSQDFRGGELSAIMGGCEIDLRQASMKGEEAVINTFAFWGGIKIKVPPSWSVSMQGFPLMGGFDDKSVQPNDISAKRLVIKGTAIMGGVEITN